MSEETTQESVDENVSTETNATAGKTTAAAESTTAKSETDTKTAEAPKYDYVPAKFLKEDGSPDFEKLAKSYVGLEKKLGSKPNIPAGSADEYEYDFTEFAPPEENIKAFKEEAFKHGLTKEQYNFVVKSHFDVINNIAWSADKAATTLKADWGQNFDSMTQAARAGFDEYAASDSNPNDPIWNHPAVMKLLARIGTDLGEDSFAGKNSGAKVSTAPDRSEIDKLMAAPDYWDNKDSQAKVAAWYRSNVK